MFNYLAFLHGAITTPGERAFADGETLATQCIDGLKKIDNPEQFPPRLLILLASPAYREQPKAAQLVAGVQQAFVRAGYSEIPLIGSSVAAVFFERQIHEQGALLVCLASRLLKARVAVGPNANQDPDVAVRDLLRGLDMDSPPAEDANPFGDRTLFTFFPGGAKDTSDQRLHKRLIEAVATRIPIVGGVSSVDDPERADPGLQFAGHDVYRGVLVAALITSGCHLVTSLGMGLSATGHVVHTEAVSENKKRIEGFHEGPPSQALKEDSGLVLLGRRTRDNDLIMALRRPGAGDEPVEILRDLEENRALEIFKPDPTKMRTATALAVQGSMQRFSMENPVGCLLLICASYYRYRREIGLDIEVGIEEIQNTVRHRPCVGGFVDGEAGAEKSGRSIFTNWSIAAITFGDEMRARTPSQRGFAALAQHSPALNKAALLEEVIRESLELVFDVGFPGAIISLLMLDQDSEWIVARGAIGSRFNKVVEETRRRLDGEDILAVVARENTPRFIPESRIAPSIDQPYIEKSGIISQFVMPLSSIQGDVLATLQVDLGDASYKIRLHDTEEQVLQSLGAAVGESLRGVFNGELARITGGLDKALVESLSAATVEEGLQCFVEGASRAFGAEMGHFRLADHEKHLLRLVAGTGPYYDAAKKVRGKIDFLDESPSARSFLSGNVTVVNFTQNNPEFKAFRDRYADCYEASLALHEIRSYANLALKNSKGWTTGTVFIGSSQSWFFTPPRVRSLNALAQRAGILVEHLTNKQSEAEGRKLLTFMLDVGPHLAKIANFRDSRAVLQEATSRFCRAAMAEVASLYLWDNELQKYILRAQEGWIDPDWVDAARYGKGDGRTGTMALVDRPRYIGDVRSKQSEAYGKATGRYARQMFGSGLPDDVTLEGIALPLKVGNERLGVLTLYRRVLRSKAGGTSNFVSVDPDVLQEAADHMAGLVNALLSFQATVWEEQERHRREEVYAVLVRESGEQLEERICQQVARSFRAVEVALYLPDKSTEPTRLKCAANLNRDSRKSSRPVPDGLIIDAILTGKVAISRQSIADGQRDDPKWAVIEGLVNRACIPIRSEDKPYGVLDLHWRLRPGNADPFITRHDSKQLQILGDMIGSAYHRHILMAEREEAMAQAERSQRATLVMAAMVFQNTHRFRNTIQRLRIRRDHILDAPDDVARNNAIDELTEPIETAIQLVDRPMNLAERILNPAYARQQLSSLVKQVLPHCSDQFAPPIELSMTVPEDVIVLADREQVVEAFRNIVDNAFQAMPAGGILSVTAGRTLDRKRVSIIFEDTGIGMTEEEKKGAMTGFFSTKGHKGVGVLLTSVLIAAQGGTVDIQSAKGMGTKVTIMLPSPKVED